MQTGRCHLGQGKALGLGMVGMVPAMMGIVLVCGSAAVVAAEERPDIGATAPLAADALVVQAEALRQSGDLIGAREQLVMALQRDPTHAGARTALASLDSQAAGTPAPFDHDPVGGDVRLQAALAESRMQASRAELLAAGGRFEDAIVLLAQARVMLQPYVTNEAVRAEAQNLDGQLAAYRERHLVERDASMRDARQSARRSAELTTRRAEKNAAARLTERIERVEELERKKFIESALAACRKLVDEFPREPRVDALYARLINKSHAQRELTIKEQRDELLQETLERLERSLIPSGFDGWPDFAPDWHLRHVDQVGLGGPTRLEPWEEALNEKLSTRVSYNFVEQNALEVLAALAKQSGINLVVDPAVSAAGDVVITLKANDITLRNTLSWISRLAGTTWRIERGAVYVGGEAENKPVLAIYDVSELLFMPKDQAGKQLAFTGAAAGTGGGGGAGAGGAGFNLFQMAPDDAAAPSITPEDLVDLIQKSVNPTIWQNQAYGISIRGTTLLVTAPTSTHLLIQEFIRSQANQKSQLVRVTARWLTIKDGYLEEIGVDWRSDKFQSPAATNPTILQVPAGSPHGALPVEGTGYHRLTSDFDHSGSLINNLPAAASAPQASTLASQGLNLQAMLVNQTLASAIISAVETNTQGNILEAPEVVTMSGVRANTFMGSQYAYIGDYASAPPANTLDGTLDPDIGVLNLGASLDIKPYVSADGKYVTMEFRPAIASLESVFFETVTVQRFIPTGFVPGGGNGNGNGQVIGNIVVNNFGMELPNILIREVATQIMVPDGGTILVGGFGRAIEQTMSTKIPFLGHIPFLGRLFGKRGRYSDRYQLYLLADIHIINYAELEAKL